MLALFFSTAFLATHLPFLTPGPAGIDSANFSLGVRDFDIAQHRPHPPGYPVFIALGKLSQAALTPHLREGHSTAYEARALALWSAIFGAGAVFPLIWFFRGLELDDRRAIAATALTVTCPLFWFCAIRAMSDIPGLTAALGVQALLIAAYRRSRTDDPSPDDRRSRALIVTAAFAAGVAIGFRTQTAWLTLPLLALVLIDHRRRRLPRATLATAAVFTLGVLLWGIPLLATSGGPSGYLAALNAQAGEDLAGVDLLVTNPTARRLTTGLVHTLAFPWAAKHLAAIVIGFATVGGVVMLLRARVALGLLAAAAIPYAVFHLLFQESFTVRYALPLVPAAAYLAVRGLDAVTHRSMAPLAGALAAGCLLVAVPPVLTYARAGSPAHQALADIRVRLEAEAASRPVLAEHHAIARVMRGEQLPVHMLPSPPRREWLELVKYWREGGDAPVWFLAEPGRTDLALIDPAARRLVRSYRWPFARTAIVSGVRPEGIDWYEMTAPGWFAEEGWALTPETAGVATLDRRGPSNGPIVAYVRRRKESAIVLIGGRNLEQRGDADAYVDVLIDGRLVGTALAPLNERFFLRMFSLPAGSLTGSSDYARLEVSSRAATRGARLPRVGIEQFDLQSTRAVVYGFDSGWYEQEYDPGAARLWRWTGPSASLRVHHAGRDVTLGLQGELPLEYLQARPRISVRAGSQLLGRFTPDREVALRVQVPARALIQSGGLLTIETDQTFVPAVALRNGDGRRLGLRVYELTVR